VVHEGSDIDEILGLSPAYVCQVPSEMPGGYPEYWDAWTAEKVVSRIEKTLPDPRVLRIVPGNARTRIWVVARRDGVALSWLDVTCYRRIDELVQAFATRGWLIGDASRVAYLLDPDSISRGLARWDAPDVDDSGDAFVVADQLSWLEWPEDEAWYHQASIVSGFAIHDARILVFAEAWLPGKHGRYEAWELWENDIGEAG